MSVPISEALRFWFKLGFISFGGPAGQIALLHRELVERRRWIDEERFLHALNFCMVLPGPEAQQLATYVGWLLHGRLGGIVAGTLFVLPSALLLWALSWIYVTHGDVGWVAALFEGLQPAVLALIAAAVPRIGRRALRSPTSFALAAAAFVATAFLDVPFPLVVLGAALVGALGRAAPAPTGIAVQPPVRLGSTLATACACLALWWLPVVAAGLSLGWQGTHAQQGVFFSEAAVVTFGGAYAVLPYVADRAVEHFGWLAPHEMLAGLGLAETTPGPLIMVVQFVGFLGGWRAPGPFSPLAGGTLAAALTTWVTFLPCFLWVFVGAPYMERLRGWTRLSSALGGVTAAVVGVVLQLALWFGEQTLRAPGGGLDGVAAAVAILAFVGLQWRRWEALPVVLGCAGLGLVRHLLFA